MPACSLTAGWHPAHSRRKRQRPRNGDLPKTICRGLMMEDYNNAISEAAVARELEFGWIRLTGLVAILAAIIAAAPLFGREPLWFYAVAFLYQALTVAVTYPFALVYARRSIRAMSHDPAGFASGHRYPRLRWDTTRPPLLDEPGLWLSFPLLIAMSGIFAAAIWFSRAGITTAKHVGPMLFLLLLTVAVNLITDSTVWVRRGRGLLHSELGIDTLRLMPDAGYEWSRFWGWKPAAPTDDLLSMRQRKDQ